MRRTNQKVRAYLEKRGVQKIFIKEHSRFSKDIWGLFDGFYIDTERGIVLMQIKTNRFSGMKSIEDFAKLHRVPCEIIMFKDRDTKAYVKEFLPVKHLNHNT